MTIHVTVCEHEVDRRFQDCRICDRELAECKEIKRLRAEIEQLRKSFAELSDGSQAVITRQRKEIGERNKALVACKVKLKKLFDATSGVYHGGVEHSQLIQWIDKLTETTKDTIRDASCLDAGCDIDGKEPHKPTCDHAETEQDAETCSHPEDARIRTYAFGKLIGQGCYVCGQKLSEKD